MFIVGSYREPYFCLWGGGGNRGSRVSYRGRDGVPEQHPEEGEE